METNNVEYGKILKDIAENTYYIYFNSDLETCVFDDGTYRDCPTKDIQDGN